MPNYRLEELKTRGMAPLARLLITKAHEFDKTSYGEAAHLLEQELDIPSVNPRHCGKVMGSLMYDLLDYDEALPPLNALLVKTDGKPSYGADEFIDGWSGKAYSRMSEENRASILSDAWRAVWSYPDWENVYHDVFGRKFRVLDLPGPEPTPGEYGGPAESPEHKRLRLAIKADPGLAVPVSDDAVARTEVALLSGDRVDVRVIDARRDYAIEVKSIRSNHRDLERGIFQAVKYRAVIESEYRAHGAEAAVMALLVSERELPGSLKGTAKKLKVKTKVVEVNRRRRSASR